MHWPKEKLFLNHMRKDWGICFPRGMHWIWLVWEGFLLNISGVYYVLLFLHIDKHSRFATLLRNWTQHLKPERERAYWWATAPPQVRVRTAHHFFPHTILQYPSALLSPITILLSFILLLPMHSTGICLANRTPHSVFYDYLPEPAFIPPTKRQSDKSGRPKAKEKKENCKQQWVKHNTVTGSCGYNHDEMWTKCGWEQSHHLRGFGISKSTKKPPCARA